MRPRDCQSRVVPVALERAIRSALPSDPLELPDISLMMRLRLRDLVLPWWHHAPEMTVEVDGCTYGVREVDALPEEYVAFDGYAVGGEIHQIVMIVLATSSERARSVPQHSDDS